MTMSRSISPRLQVVALVALSGCGGKLAPLEGDGGARDAAAFDSGGRPVVTQVDPSSGPNSGGTTVAVHGSGFATDGGTQVTFGGSPASQVTCTSDSECIVISPWAGPSSTPMVMDVQATVNGVLGDPDARTSARQGEDLFTYTAGPDCNAAQVCNGLELPLLVVSCPGQVSFYAEPWKAQQELVAQASTYSAHTAVCGDQLAACDGTPTNGSCSTYSLVALQLQCGAENYCKLCKELGGMCSLGPDPVCCNTICTTALPTPPCP